MSSKKKINKLSINNRKSHSLVILFIALSLLLSGCATNPVTGETQLSLVSEQQELALGKQQYASSIQQQGGAYHADPKVNAYIASVGNKLAKLSHKPNLPYEFTVINSPVPNAWALPGGKIAFNRGLLVMLEDEAQLAAVLGHEIVHVTARHGAQGMSKGILLDLGANLAGVLSGANGDLISQGLRTGGGMVIAKYGRDQELEADLYGTRYMSQAGYDPKASAELQAKLMTLAKSQSFSPLEALFASHPPSYDRMKRNEETARQLTGTKRNKTRFQQQLATLFKDKKAYENYNRAVKLRSEKQYDEALQLVNQAIAMQRNEGSFWELKGDLLFLKNQKTKGIKAYDSAIKVNPNFFQHHLARGIALNDIGQYQKASQDLTKANQILPTRIGIFYNGEAAFNQGNYASAKRYYTQLISADDVWAKNASKRLNEIAQR